MELTGSLLHTSYLEIKTSRLVNEHDVSRRSINHFTTMINRSRPVTPSDMLLYNFVQTLSSTHDKKFIELINDTRLECLILWTQPVTILKFLNIHKIIRMRIENVNMICKVDRIHKSTNTSTRHPLIQSHVNIDLRLKTPDIVNTNDDVGNDGSSGSCIGSCIGSVNGGLWGDSCQ